MPLALFAAVLLVPSMICFMPHTKAACPNYGMCAKSWSPLILPREIKIQFTTEVFNKVVLHILALPAGLFPLQNHQVAHFGFYPYVYFSGPTGQTQFLQGSLDEAGRYNITEGGVGKWGSRSGATFVEGHKTSCACSGS